MNIESFFSSYYPKKIVTLCGLPSYTPLNSAFEGYAVQGSGCGFGYKSLQGAYGEFIERRHFFTEVKTDAVGKIHDYNNNEFSKKLYDAINQIKITDQDPQKHDFQLVKVNNLFDQSDAYVPKRFVSLSNINPKEEAFIPLMDSCGIAVHSTPSDSKQAALNEFVERQSLVGSWLSQCDIYQYETTLLKHFSDAERLAEQLLANGELFIFDLSNDLSAYTIAICYFSKSKKDKVQYAIGVSADKSFIRALKGAFLELWQDYTYLYCYTIYDKPSNDNQFFMYAGDTYHMSHFQDNTLETRDRIPYFNRAEKKQIHINKIKIHADAELLESLKKISQYIYYYQATDRNHLYSYSRIISPDFYLHMSIHEPLNFFNAYADSLHAGKVPKTRQRIPFP